MSSEQDLTFFQLVKSDDFEAYETIFKKYYQELYRFAYNYLRDQVPAEEMAQEVFYIYGRNEPRLK